MDQPLIVYLHGFCSSPASGKVQRLRERMARRSIEGRLWCEQLAPSPRQAVELAQQAITAADGPVTLVGSSLGGFYATWLAEHHGLPAVLVNPAVVERLALDDWVGPQTLFHSGERFDFTLQHLAQLRALETPAITRPERYLLLAETGDEVLDWRHAAAKYAGAGQIILRGGDHGFSHWDEYVDTVLNFAGFRA